MTNPINQTPAPLPAAFAWWPESRPAYQKFYEALDDFSYAATSQSWFMLTGERPPIQPWGDKQRTLLSRALAKAPTALMVAPYSTVQNLIKLRDIAATHDELPESFWDPFREACITWQLEEKDEKKSNS